MRRIQLRQRGNRPQGEPFTGENANKGIDFTEPELKIEDIRPEKKPVKKKASVIKKVKDVAKKVAKKVKGK